MKKTGMSKNATVNPSTTAAVPTSQRIGEDSHQYIADTTKTPFREKLKGFGKNVAGRCARALDKIQNSKTYRGLMMVLSVLDSAASAISRGLWRLLVIGLLALIPLALFPELGEKFPVFFQVSEGIIALFNWMWQAVFGFIRIIVELFTRDFGTASDIFNSIWNDFIGLFQELWNWIQNIPF